MKAIMMILAFSIMSHAANIKVSLDQSGLGIGYSGENAEHSLVLNGSNSYSHLSANKDTNVIDNDGYTMSVGYRFAYSVLKLKNSVDLNVGLLGQMGYAYQEMSSQILNSMNERRFYSIQPEASLEKQIDQFSVYARLSYLFQIQTDGSYLKSSNSSYNETVMGDHHYLVTSFSLIPALGISYMF